MQAFLAWFNRTRTNALDGIVRAGLAHVWFESIHPFEDGNGRVGRAVIDLALAQDVRQATRLHGVATELRRRQGEYYETLNQAQRGTGEVTDWLVWFVGAFTDSCRASSTLIDESLVRARFWRDNQHIPLNERQRKVLNKVLEMGPRAFEGGLTQRKYANMTGISRVTAWRDLEDLLHKKLITPGSAKGRSTHYNINIPGWEWLPQTPSPPRGHAAD
jgi:Fic family protein